MQPVQLKEHQQKAVDQLDNGKILYGGTGSGKSLTAIAYFFTKVCGGTPGDFGSVTSNPDIYIITTAKKRDTLDWEKEAQKYGIGKERNGTVANIKLTVDSWNNIQRYVGVKDAFFIFDEQRLVGSGAWSQTFIKIAKHNQWILLSATPGDTWMDYIPVFVANGFYKNRTEFKREHVVYNTFTKFPKVDRYINTGRLVRLRNHVLVHMPFERHTTRHGKMVKVDYDQDMMKRVTVDRWHVYENRPIRDVSELFSVMRKVANSDSSRLEAVTSLMSRHPRLIVFYNFDYELEILRTLSQPTSTLPSTTSGSDNTTTLRENDPLKGTIWEEGWDEKEALQQISSKSRKSSSYSSSPHGKSGMSDISTVEGKSKPDTVEEVHSSPAPVSIAEWNGHKHEEIPKTDRWVYLVQYTAGSEGWNCITTDTVCFYSLTYSYKQWHQGHGRIDRMNTPFVDLWYYTLLSDSDIDRAIMKSLKSKKSFNERNLVV